MTTPEPTTAHDTQPTGRDTVHAHEDGGREALHRHITKAWLVHIGFQPDDVDRIPDTTEHEVYGCEPSANGYDCMDEDGLSRHPMSDAADQTAEFVGFVLDQLSGRVAAAVAAERERVAVAIEGMAFRGPDNRMRKASLIRTMAARIARSGS